MCQNIHVAVLPITESDRRVPCYQRISQLFDMYGAKVIDFDVSGKKCKVIIEISDENLTVQLSMIVDTYSQKNIVISRISQIFIL